MEELLTVLGTSKKNMNMNEYKIAVVLSCNDNPNYTQWVEYTCRAWRKLGVDPILFSIDAGDSFVGPERIIQVKNKYGVKSSSVAQVCRLYAPSLLTEYDSVLIADIDQIPLPNPYFEKYTTTSIAQQSFVVMRKVGSTYFMGWNTAPPSVWAELTGVWDLDSFEAKLASIYSSNKNPAWGLDQSLLHRYVSRYDNTIFVEDLDYYAISVEPGKLSRKGIFRLNKPKPAKNIQLEDIDFSKDIIAGTATARHFDASLLEQILNKY